jgi:hypothetical protein
MLASTVQFSSYERSPPSSAPTPTHPRNTRRPAEAVHPDPMSPHAATLTHHHPQPHKEPRTPMRSPGDPSEPASACSLRTQQRAKPTTTPAPPVPPPSEPEEY